MEGEGIEILSGSPLLASNIVNNSGDLRANAHLAAIVAVGPEFVILLGQIIRRQRLDKPEGD